MSLTLDNKTEAVRSLKPGAEYVWNEGDRTDAPYSGLTWLDSKQTKPTEAEIDAEVTRLANEKTANLYQRKRAAEYPSVVDQLDDIYHNGIDAWKATIKTTKDKYPKP
jgi:hypothetical protein